MAVTLWQADLADDTITPIECVKADGMYVWIDYGGSLARRRRSEGRREICDTWEDAKARLLADRYLEINAAQLAVDEATKWRDGERDRLFKVQALKPPR